MHAGVESLAVSPGLRATSRWLAASAIMLATFRRVQLFPHMTMVYRAGNKS
jgi:hypothetical protein